MFVFSKLFWLLFLLENVWSANILYLAPVASPSHHIWNKALALGLVAKGHNVTLADPDVDTLPKPKNYTFILLEGVYEDLHEEFDHHDMANQSPLSMLGIFREWSWLTCSKIVKSNGLQQLLNYPEDFKFDLIIYDITVGYFLHPLIARFNNPPVVGVSAFILPPYLSYNFGNHLYPSYLPWYGLPHSSDMSFLERVWNFVYMHLDVALRNNLEYTKEDELIKEVFKDNQISWREAEKGFSLMLSNSDPILDYPQPVTPNIIQVGGLHTRPSKELPKDLKEILDNARNGVILFSLGTNVRSDGLGEATIKSLLAAFSKLKETVIWKFESDFTNLPKNVIVRKWLPQNDLLGHPNVKLFIGHGGCLSTQEAIYHGVPMMCVPFILDQVTNSRLIVDKRLGIKVNFKKLADPDYVSKNLREVLDNPVYFENMRTSSARFKNRLETPLERATFWIEYVLRHGHAHFLQSKARDMPFYQSSGTDVITFLVVLIILVTLIIYRIVTELLHLLFPVKKIKKH